MLASARRVLSTAGRRFASAEAFPSYIINAPATETTTLGNGLRVASEGGHGETATVGVWIDAGSRYETDENNGVAHFLEHMAFKGTGKRSQYDLEVEIENMGGHLNAYTSREMTVYYAKVFKNDVPKAVEILSDILLNSTLNEAAIDKEREVILREMKEVMSNNEEVVFDHLHETAYMGGGLGRTILGPKENIAKIDRDQLVDYIKTHYTAPRMVVAGAGAVEHDQLADLADKHFGSLLSAPPAGSIVPHDPARFTGSEIRFREDSMPTAHMALAVESAGWTSPHAFPLMVMQTLLGSWTRTSNAGKNSGSKLAQACAEYDLCHSFMAFNTCYKDTGLFGVYATMENKTCQDMTYWMLETMVGLCHHVTDEEVQRAKAQLKTTMLMQLDGSSAVCEDIGRQMLVYNRRMTPAEVFARIDAVDADAVMNAAKQFVWDNDVAMSAIGPIHELPDYNYMRRRTYWYRY